MNQKLDEIKRSLEKYVNSKKKTFFLFYLFLFIFFQDRLDKRIDDAIHQFERKTTSLEDYYKRAISDLTRNNEVMNRIFLDSIFIYIFSLLNKLFINDLMKNIKKLWLI